MPRSLLLSLCLLSGCTTPGFPEHGGKWGEGMTLLPNGGRLRTAASEAFSHPWTWVPAVGALAIEISDQDDDISEWARDHTPVFGSKSNAAEQSTDLRNLLRDAVAVSTVFTDSGSEPGLWLQRKVVGYSAFEASAWMRNEATDLFKRSSGRLRPDTSDDRSFPSGHTSAAFNYAVWTNSNLDYIDMHGGLREGLKWTNLLVAAGVGWGRVEAGRHYPTDVLLGAALGNATSLFFQRAFVGIPEPGEPQLKLQITPDGFAIGLHWSF
ncbi:MAG: phosphatase PAP2 family protein [bacterium]|nr:phosphatase PAP2 family protein [bacterium]